MTNGENAAEHEIRLYGLLVDQIHKYNTIFWQFPTALAVANFFALRNYLSHSEVILALVALDSALVYAFTKMVRRQQEIIRVAREAEEELRRTFGHFVPLFAQSRVRAPWVTMVTLWGLDLSLLLWDINLWLQ